MPKNILITGTRHNEGKTAITIGLTAGFCRRNKVIGFIKPVGQADVSVGRRHVDEDTLLIEKACRIHCNLDDMNPVLIRAGFPEELTHKDVQEEYRRKATAAYKRVSEGKEFVVIEGTGHAAVGAAFGLSNTDIAKLFDAHVLLVSSGGVAHPVDEILLNKVYFESFGVKLLGVIINKVYPEEMEKVASFTRPILEAAGVRVFGIVPFDQALYSPSIIQVMEEVRGELLNGEQNIQNRAGKILVGAMTTHNALEYLQGDVLLVTPGDRDDMILAAVVQSRLGDKKAFNLTGIVLTGGFYPQKPILDILKKTDIPVMVARLDSYTTAQRLHALTVKISPWDKLKIDGIINLIDHYVHIDDILTAVGGS